MVREIVVRFPTGTRDSSLLEKSTQLPIQQLVGVKRLEHEDEWLCIGEE